MYLYLRATGRRFHVNKQIIGGAVLDFRHARDLRHRQQAHDGGKCDRPAVHRTRLGHPACLDPLSLASAQRAPSWRALVVIAGIACFFYRQLERRRHAGKHPRNCFRSRLCRRIPAQGIAPSAISNARRYWALRRASSSAYPSTRRRRSSRSTSCVGNRRARRRPARPGVPLPLQGARRGVSRDRIAHLDHRAVAQSDPGRDRGGGDHWAASRSSERCWWLARPPRTTSTRRATGRILVLAGARRA